MSSVRPFTVCKLETFMPLSIPHHYVLPQPSFLFIIFTIICNNFWFTHLSQFYHLSHQGSPIILEWVAYPFSRESSWPRNWTGVSCIAGRFFTNWGIREAWIEIIKTLIESNQCYTMWETADILKISKSINKNQLHQLGCFLLCVDSTQVKQRKKISWPYSWWQFSTSL